jgi:hypothetical protein
VSQALRQIPPCTIPWGGERDLTRSVRSANPPAHPLSLLSPRTPSLKGVDIEFLVATVHLLLTPRPFPSQTPSLKGVHIEFLVATVHLLLTPPSRPFPNPQPEGRGH